MNPELDALLCERYPKIFANRRLGVDKSPMGRGFEIGDGWFDLIDTLYQGLQSVTDRGGPQIKASQVKEKFGALRFYTKGENDQQRGMIDLAEGFSARICEVCGNRGALDPSSFGVRCAEHAGGK